MQSEPHICFVAPHAYPILARSNEIKFAGGAEVQQSFIAKALAKVGYKVSMISLDYGQEDECVIEGVTVLKAHKSSDGIPVLRFFYPRLTSFWRAMKRLDADIYYQRTAAMHTGLVASFCRFHRKKFVYAASHNTNFIPGEQTIKLKRDLLWYEWGIRRADKIIVQNKDQSLLLKKNYNMDSVLIPSCYERSDKHGSNCERKRGNILWVSTIKEWKRPEIFVNLSRRLPDYKFTMIGGPGSGQKGRALFGRIAEQAKHIPNLDFVGFIPFSSIDKYFDEACLFVNTSILEGFPNTFLQAWSRGIPTVSFFDTGARLGGEHVGSKINTEEEFFETVGKLLAKDMLYSKYSSKCLKYFNENHSMEIAVSHYRRVFGSLMGIT